MQTIKTEENIEDKKVNFPEQNQDSFITVNQAEAKQFLQALADSLSEIDSFKEYISNNLTMKMRDIENFENTTISLFNSLVETASELKQKIEVAGNYENYLEERIKNANLSKEISLLELQLNKEKAEITLTLKEITETVKKSVFSIESKTSELKSANNIIEENIQNFSSKTGDFFSDYVKKAETELEDIGNHLIAISENQQNLLKMNCEQFLKNYTEKCSNYLETMKTQSLNFLKECEDENKKLIKKVPYMGTKISKKDFIIYVFCALTFVGIILDFFI